MLPHAGAGPMFEESLGPSVVRSFQSAPVMPGRHTAGLLPGRHSISIQVCFASCPFLPEFSLEAVSDLARISRQQRQVAAASSLRL